MFNTLNSKTTGQLECKHLSNISTRPLGLNQWTFHFSSPPSKFRELIATASYTHLFQTYIPNTSFLFFVSSDGLQSNSGGLSEKKETQIQHGSALHLRSLQIQLHSHLHRATMAETQRSTSPPLQLTPKATRDVWSWALTNLLTTWQLVNSGVNANIFWMYIYIYICYPPPKTYVSERRCAVGRHICSMYYKNVQIHKVMCLLNSSWME